MAMIRQFGWPTQCR